MQFNSKIHWDKYVTSVIDKNDNEYKPIKRYDVLTYFLHVYCTARD